MPIYSEKYAEVAARFKEWMTDRDNVGDHIIDVAKDYINRANQVLWSRAFWDDLITHSALSFVGLAATLPSDYGRIYCVYSDSDGDGKPDFFYFKDGRYGQGYSFRRTFSKDTGSVFVMTFFTAPSSPAYVVYQKKLEDFTGNGDEYLFWPAELLLREAQCLSKEDADDLGGDYDKLMMRKNQLLDDFKTHHQFTNPDYRMELRDAEGNTLANESYSLDNGASGNFNRFDNSRDSGLI